MPLGSWSPIIFAAKAVREGVYSDAFLEETRKPSSELLKILRIDLPPITETIELAPNATTLADPNTVVVGAASRHEALDDPADAPDDDTSYLRSNLANTATEDRVGFPPLPSDVIGVREVLLFARGATGFEAGDIEDDGPWSFALRVNGTNYVADQAAPRRFFNLSYRTQVLRFPLDPDTGSAWTVAAVNALEASLFTQPDGFGSAFGQRITQVRLAAVVTRAQVGLYSSDAVNSRSEGLYENKVTAWGAIRYSAAGTSNAVDRVTAKVQIADPTNDIGRLLAGERGDEARLSPVLLRYASPSIDDKSQWFTAFKGVLDTWNELEPRLWELTFRTDDSALESVVPRIKFTEFDFPAADPKIFGLFMQVLYGIHDTQGLSNDGAVACFNVDRVRFRRLPSLAVMKAVTRVYSKGNQDEPPVLRTADFAPGNATTAGYRVITPVVNGRQYTMVEFNLAGQPQEEIDKFNELEVTADVEGVEDVGDGSGALVRNADAIKHFFTNFVEGNYQSGPWLPDSALLDLGAFAEIQAYLNDLGQDTSRAIGGASSAKKAKDEIADWAFQLRVKVFWQEDGTLAARPNDPFVLEIYRDEPWLREGLHDVEDPDFNFDDSELLQRVFVNYIHRSASGDFLANIEVHDQELPGDKAETVDATWFRAALPETSP